VKIIKYIYIAFHIYFFGDSEFQKDKAMNESLSVVIFIDFVDFMEQDFSYDHKHHFFAKSIPG